MNTQTSFATTAMGRLALAAAFNTTSGSLPRTALYAAAAAGWLGERRRLLGQNLDKDAMAMVRLKDLLVAGTVLTGVASVVAERMRQKVDGHGTHAISTVDQHGRSLKAMRVVNRVFVAAAVAATPFINFALFNDYRPNPVPSFFKL